MIEGQNEIELRSHAIKTRKDETTQGIHLYYYNKRNNTTNNGGKRIPRVKSYNSEDCSNQIS